MNRYLFSSPTYAGGKTNPSTIVKNLTSSSAPSYFDVLRDNLTTLSSNFVPGSGVIQGLLYVPDLAPGDPCQNVVDTIVPANVTRQAALPPTNYNLIAIAPWINADCAMSYLDEARTDPLRAFIFYQPNGDYSPPPSADDDLWQLDEDGSWKNSHHFPIYAISGGKGAEMMTQLSLYSGKIGQVPFGDDIAAIYNPDEQDYARIWTRLHVSPDTTFPGLWICIIAIVSVLVLVIGGTSLLMHYMQYRRRVSLRRRVMSGETDLEALGIKRLHVPAEHIESFPLFTYSYDAPAPPLEMPPQSPNSNHRSFSQSAPSSLAIKINTRTDYQPTCLICLDHFVSRSTIIRELPCGHIFHPDCIDEFLGEISSLCPLCRTSMLPRGYCPKITNSMARREIATQKLRPRTAKAPRAKSARERRFSRTSIIKKVYSHPSSPVDEISPIEVPERVVVATGDSGELGLDVSRRRMQELAVPIDETSSDDGKPPWRLAAKRVFPGFK
ncbi:RING finger domain-containing protein [Apiospora marii]|uniref:RING finger domain-containing protein n=1 Tax=Apiospora marii TaxID=335849 RepID=UPI00312E7AFB